MFTFSRPRVFFQSNAGGGGGNNPDPSQDPSPAGGGSGTQPGNTQPEKKEFTQEQLDKLFGDTRKQGRDSLQKEILEKGGFASLDDLYAAAAAHKKSEEEKLSEIEKANKARDDAQANAKKTNDELRTLRLQRDFEKTVKTLELEFKNDRAAETAFRLLDIETAGKDEKGMDEAVKALLKEHDYLFSDAEAETRTVSDATSKGKTNSAVVKQEIVKNKRASGQYSSI